MGLLDAVRPVDKQALEKDLYSLNRIRQFKPLLEKILADGVDCFISSKIAGYKPRSLHVYLNAALKDLSTFSSEEQSQKWQLFRKLVEFRPAEDGVFVIFKRPILMDTELSPTPKEPDYSWREDFTKFVEDGKQGEIREFTGVLNDGDKKFVTGVVNGIQGEVEFGPFSFKVIL